MRALLVLFLVLLAGAQALVGSFSGARLSPASTAAKAPAGASGMTMDVKIVVGDGESVESAITRFKRAVARSGHLQELKHRRYFETTQERNKRKAALARKRARIMRSKMRKMNDF